MLAPLTQTKGVTFINLQKNASAEQIQELNLIDWTQELRDFSDTAALINNLDLMISVDTSVAHLAGALGKPVWVLAQHSPDWRWMLDRTDSPWYPTMRLFRQPKPGDWPAVIQEIARAMLDA